MTRTRTNGKNQKPPSAAEERAALEKDIATLQAEVTAHNAASAAAVAWHAATAEMLAELIRAAEELLNRASNPESHYNATVYTRQLERFVASLQGAELELQKVVYDSRPCGTLRSPLDALNAIPG